MCGEGKGIQSKGKFIPSMQTERQHCVVQKEKARSRQRTKSLEEELTRMRTMQDSLNRKIKANTEVGAYPNLNKTLPPKP